MILDQVAAAASPEVPMNENFSAVKAAGVFSEKASTTSGLTWGYYGADVYNGNASIADGTVSLTDNATNYVVVLRSTGVVSVSTATTHSVDPLYKRLRKLTTVSGAVTVNLDERWEANGLFLDPGSPATDIAAATHAATSKNPPVDADELPITDSAASYVLKKLTFANLGAWIWTKLGALINGGTDKTTPVDADSLPLSDSAASNATKRLTWANLKATLATYIATLGYASTSYVDTVVNARSWKNAVRAASTANVTLASAVENGDTLDGVTLATGDRILLKDQSSGAENGIYTVNASGAPTRAVDADAGSELVNATVAVSEGSTNADRQYTCTTDAPITLGSTSLTWTQTGTGAGGITALTGDVTASGAGSVAATIANSAVTLAKIANAAANSKLLGSGAAGSGAAYAELTLGSGLSMTGTTLNVSGTNSGTNTGDQTITLTGDVTGSGAGSFAATIANDAVTYAKMQNVSAASRLLGRGSAGGAGDPEELTAGGGLSILATVLQAASVINTQTGTTYAIVAGDRGKHVTQSNAASIATSIAQAGTTGFEDGFWTLYENIGVGAVTITPTTSTINGAATLVLTSGMAAWILSDGTNYRAIVDETAGVPVNAQTGTSYTYLSGDRKKLVTHTNGSAIAGTLPQATGAFGASWFMWVQNRGVGTLTITPTTSTIDGAATLALTTGQGCLIASDGTNYYTMRGIGGAGGGSTQGKHAVFVAAGSMLPSATGGCYDLARIATSANHPDLVTLDFDPSTETYAQFSLVMPKSWNEGTLTAMFHWSHAATVTNFGTVWGIQAVAVSDNDSIDAAYGTAQTVADTGGTTSNLYTSAETSAMTVAGTPAAQDMVCFRVYRKAADGSDTMTINARLHGVTVFMTTDADTDA